MATIAQVGPEGQLSSLEPILKPIRNRIRQAREHRKTTMEPTWQSNLAFAKGQHWLVWDRDMRKLVPIENKFPQFRGRELYQADIITEYRTTVLGELGSDDDRPELLLQRDDLASEDFQAAVNRAVGYGWDQEWKGDEALAEVDRLCIDLGTAAVRCRFDPSAGPALADQVPFHQGKPVFGDQAAQLFQDGPNPDVSMQRINQGRILWEPISAFGILVPPGVTHERYFPHLTIVRPTLLQDVKDEYGEMALGLKEDGDIASSLGDSTFSGSPQAYATGEGRKTRLRDHVWLFTHYEMPTRQTPKGRVFHFAGNDLKLLRIEEKLPYQSPDGSYRAGIAFFHWWRVTGRFWSRGLVEAMKDGQRTMNKRRTQQNELIDRGLGYVLVQKGSQAKKRSDLPLELVEIERDEMQPVIVPGVGPGPWMKDDLEQIREDVEHATGVRATALGDNPANVSTYSQLALIKEGDVVKRQPILAERKLSIAQLVEDSVYDIRTYWGPQRQIMLAGDDDEVEAETFNATKIPSFFIVKVPKGVAKPRSQGSEIQKISDIWQASLASGAVPLKPMEWVKWLKDSYDAGQALDLPEDTTDDQVEKAERENHLLLAAGVEVPVAYYDPPDVHIPIHRTAQIDAEYARDLGAWQRIEAHIQQHLQAAQENMTVTAGTQASALLAATPSAQAPGPAQPPGAAPSPSQGAS